MRQNWLKSDRFSPPVKNPIGDRKLGVQYVYFSREELAFVWPILPVGRYCRLWRDVWMFSDSMSYRNYPRVVIRRVVKRWKTFFYYRNVCQNETRHVAVRLNPAQRATYSCANTVPIHVQSVGTEVDSVVGKHVSCRGIGCPESTPMLPVYRSLPILYATVNDFIHRDYLPSLTSQTSEG